MRITRSLALGLFAVLLTTSGAMADAAMRVFDSAVCSARFSCTNTDANTLSNIASDCTAQQMGRPMSFSDASLDGNNCLTVGSPSAQHSSVTKCCVVQSQADLCAMQCSVLMN